jgi:hypothetical protein
MRMEEVREKEGGTWKREKHYRREEKHKKYDRTKETIGPQRCSGKE